MAGLLENPPSERRSSLPDVVPGAALPRVEDGIVYLPSGHPVDPESSEFESLLRKNLPPEILPDVLTNWRGVSAGTSRLQWFAAVLFLLASAASLYYFFPPAVHEDLVPHGGMVIRDRSSGLAFASTYSNLYREAAADYDRGDYHQVCRILKPAAEQIVQKGDRDSYALVFLYFKALRHLPKNSSGARHGAALLGELMRRNPDDPAWAQFHFELSPRILSSMDYEQVFQRLRHDASYRSELKLHLHNVDIALKNLSHLRNITNARKYSAAELKKYREDYDLFEVKLLLSRWLLLGYAAGLPTLPDNEHDPGVFEREKALRIAGKHENSACEDFWLARLFIAKNLISQDSLLNHIYWNGKYHTTRIELEREIQNCKQRLNRR